MDMTYLTTGEIATMLRVHPVTVQALCRSGALKATRFGRQWRVKREDLDAYLKQQEGAEVKKADGLAGFPTRPTIAAVL